MVQKDSETSSLVPEKLGKYDGEIFRQAAIGIALVDLGRNFLMVNPFFCKMLGYTEKELLSMNVSDITHEEDMGRNIELDDNVLQNDLESFTMEKRYIHKDGTIFWVLLSVTTGEVNGRPVFLSQVQDITESKDLEIQLKKAKEDAEKSERAKGIFLANMSHEIRTPMSGIMGASSLLLNTEMTAEQKEFSNLIHSSSQSLLKILNDILDFSKINAEELSLERMTLDYRGLIEEVMALFSSEAERKGIELKLKYFDGVPNHLLGDPTRLRQIFLNLLSNSIKFTDEGEVVIEVSLVEDTQEKETCLVKTSVSDTGIGMTPKQLENFFERFSQADQTTTRKYGGTGLGTSISKKLVELMDGKISASSEPGKGTFVEFEIPFQVSESSVLDGSKAKLKIERHYGKRIILAEDNPTNQTIMLHILKRLGLEVILANDGEEALQKAEEVQHELILMDIYMPHLDGIQATQKLVERNYEKPIVALTANVFKSDVEEYEKAGMKGYLSKPLELEKLVEILDRFL